MSRPFVASETAIACLIHAGIESGLPVCFKLQEFGGGNGKVGLEAAIL
jgi:hypothetical protein